MADMVSALHGIARATPPACGLAGGARPARSLFATSRSTGARPLARQGGASTGKRRPPHPRTWGGRRGVTRSPRGRPRTVLDRAVRCPRRGTEQRAHSTDNIEQSHTAVSRIPTFIPTRRAWSTSPRPCSIAVSAGLPSARRRAAGARRGAGHARGGKHTYPRPPTFCEDCADDDAECCYEGGEGEWGYECYAEAR
jgi:hypothetical protein